VIITFIPAAGHSTRMRGADKLLETVNGVPILARTAHIALEADFGPVLVGLRPDNEKRRKVLEGLNVKVVDIPDAELGMSATLRRGAAEALALVLRHKEGDDETSGMMVLLPDMPGINTTDLQDMEQAFSSSGGTSVRACTTDGKLGHPTIFNANALKSFQTLTGDKGAAEIFHQDNWIPFALHGDRARRDLDTPEDWADWRTETNTPD
jgi:CTP:molybdopterin cytidylyltransferase MocA